MAMNYAINAADVVQLGFVALENYLKNKPIDQVAVQHPLLKALQAKKKPWGGGNQFITEQIRKDYDNFFQWFGDATGGTKNESTDVGYNTNGRLYHFMFRNPLILGVYRHAFHDQGIRLFFGKITQKTHLLTNGS